MGRLERARRLSPEDIVDRHSGQHDIVCDRLPRTVAPRWVGCDHRVLVAVSPVSAPRAALDEDVVGLHDREPGTAAADDPYVRRATVDGERPTTVSTVTA